MDDTSSKAVVKKVIADEHMTLRITYFTLDSYLFIL